MNMAAVGHDDLLVVDFDDGDIVARMKSAFGDETLKILKRIDTKTDINAKSMLDFKELRQFVQINEHDLRRFLLEMLGSGTYPKSWKLGRRWKIPQEEKQRISVDFWAWVVKNPSTKVERPAASGDSK